MSGRILLLVAALFLTPQAWGQKAQVYADRSGAIRGHDPVAYFTEGRPVKGSSAFSYRWRDATWYFANAANRDAFAAAPEKFAPRYGGYCAYGVANGYAVSVDPAAWSIVDGKLYLNYSLSVRESWNKDIPGFIRKADGNWPRVLER